MTNQNKQKEYDEFYRLIAENTTDFISINEFSLKMPYLYASPSFKDMLGYEPSELIGQPINYLAHPDDFKKLLPLLKKYIGAVVKKKFFNDKKRVSEKIEFRAKHKSGEWRDMESTVNLIDKDRVLFVTKDVTERKRMEKKLKEKEEKLRNIIKYSNELYYIHDTKHRLTYASPQSLKILGYKPEEMMIKWTKLATDNPINKRGVEITEKALATGEKQEPYLLELKHKNGKKRLLEIDEAPYLDENNRVMGIVGAARDITDRKRAEEESEKLAAIIKYSTELVNLATADGKMIFLNDAGSKMLGIDPKEVERYNILEVIPENYKNVVREKLLPTLKKGNSWEGDLAYKNIKTKELTYVHAITFVIKDPGTNDFLYLVNISTDITERKRAEEEVIKLQQKYKQIFYNLPLIAFILDSKGRLLEANHEAEIFTGLETKDFHNKHFNEFNLLNKREILTAGMEFLKNTRGKTTKKTIYHLKRHDGEIRDVELMGIPIAYKGKVESVLDVGTDITDRRRAEEKIMNSAKEWSETFDSMSDGITIHNPSYGIINANKAICKILGRSKEEIIGKKCFQVFHNKLGPIGGCPMAKTLKNKKGQRIEIFEPFLGKWLAIYTSPVLDNEGKIIKIIHVVRDISERKQAEERINKSEQSYREIFNSSSNAIFIHDKDTGKILDINRKTVDMFGFTKEEITRCAIGDISSGQSPYSQREAVEWVMKAVKEPQSFEWKSKKKNGEIFWTMVKLRLVDIGGEKRILADVRDISEEKKSAEEVEKRNAELEKTNKAMVGRELRMIDLKRRIKELEDKINQKE